MELKNRAYLNFYKVGRFNREKEALEYTDLAITTSYKMFCKKKFLLRIADSPLAKGRGKADKPRERQEKEREKEHRGGGKKSYVNGLDSPF